MTTWQIDNSHTDVEFAVKHLMISTVKGRFAKVEGSVLLDDKDPARSHVGVTIDAASIDTRDEKRDTHLRSADFLDVAGYPTLTFVSRRVEGDPTGGFRIVGDLTIRGVTREIALTVESQGGIKDPWGNEKRGFTAKGKLDRRDFGLTWNVALEAGGIVVGDEVRIAIETELVLVEEAATAAA
jgi:polyisoprenoid-binding protein YceI